MCDEFHLSVREVLHETARDLDAFDPECIADEVVDLMVEILDMRGFARAKQRYDATPALEQAKLASQDPTVALVQEIHYEAMGRRVRARRAARR